MTKQSELLEEIIDCLNATKTRCTYGAAAGLLGIHPIQMGKHLGKKGPEVAWFVKKDGGEPAGFLDSDKHPDLYKNPHIISEKTELEDHLMKYQSSKKSKGFDVEDRGTEDRDTIETKPSVSDYITIGAIAALILSSVIGLAILSYYFFEIGMIVIGVGILIISVAVFGIEGTIALAIGLFGFFRWLDRRN